MTHGPQLDDIRAQGEFPAIKIKGEFYHVASDTTTISSEVVVVMTLKPDGKRNGGDIEGEKNAACPVSESHTRAPEFLHHLIESRNRQKFHHEQVMNEASSFSGSVWETFHMQDFSPFC